METPTVIEESSFTSILERFGSNIEQTEEGHWLWTGITVGGYPVIQLNRRTVRVSRLVYEMAYGPIPPGRRVRHQCRNRKCLRPEHLSFDMPPLPPEVVAARFWGKVQKREDGCWEWLGGCNPKGYGRLVIAGQGRMAHRVAYELTKGSIPDGAVVCHTCDNPKCCRPDHLFVGTIADNMRDKQAKGRQARGEHHGQAKLTEAKVIEMRQEYSRNRTPRAVLAKRYGVTRDAIDHVLRRKSWSHVQPELRAA